MNIFGDLTYTSMLGKFYLKHSPDKGVVPAVYEVVGIITDPAVTVLNLKTGERETHVLSSFTWEQFFELAPLEPCDTMEDPRV